VCSGFVDAITGVRHLYASLSHVVVSATKTFPSHSLLAVAFDGQSLVAFNIFTMTVL
jgi:hypothetical protein